MKRFLLYSIGIAISFNSIAQTNTWVGSVLGNWSANGNWSLGHVPTASEDVLINTNANINVNSFIGGVNNIKSLKITGGVTVFLRCNANGVRRLRMSGTSTTTKGLQIDAGNTLVFNATNTTGIGNWICDLTGANGVTGSIEGTLQFTGTGSAAGDAELDLFAGASNFANLVVAGTGRIVYSDDTGETNGGDGSNLTMQAGSVYEQLEQGSIPAGSWDAGSLVKIAYAGTNPTTFVGNSYGHLEIDCPNLTTPFIFNKNISFNDVNLVSTGTAAVVVKDASSTSPYLLAINGNLTVSSTSRLESMLGGIFSDTAGVIHVKKNIVNNGMIKGRTSATGEKIVLNGTTNQSVSGTGEWLGSNFYFTIDNPAGATLLSPINLRCSLELTNGKIKTDSINYLMLSIDTSTGTPVHWIGGSNASFVEGPMKRVTTSVAFKFPVGKGNFFAPCAYRNALNYFATDTFTAEYFRVNPQSVYGTNYDGAANPAVIHHISYVEYWKFRKNAGGLASVRIEPDVKLGSYCNDLNATFVVRFDGTEGKWKGCGTLGNFLTYPGPPFVEGRVYSHSIPASGSIIVTLATSSTSNPLSFGQAGSLPIDLVAFDAKKINSSKSLLTWEVADYCKPGARFEIQAARNDRAFQTIGVTEGNQTSLLYNYTDYDLKTGVNYYRLKMIDEFGVITYSRTAAVMNGSDGLVLTSLIPTVVSGKAALTISASQNEKMDLLIIDMIGRTVHRRNLNLSAGNTTIEISTEELSAGTYQLVGVSSSGRTNVVRFIKE